jgi:hypothetical protein
MPFEATSSGFPTTSFLPGRSHYPTWSDHASTAGVALPLPNVGAGPSTPRAFAPPVQLSSNGSYLYGTPGSMGLHALLNPTSGNRHGYTGGFSQSAMESSGPSGYGDPQGNGMHGTAPSYDASGQQQVPPQVVKIEDGQETESIGANVIMDSSVDLESGKLGGPYLELFWPGWPPTLPTPGELAHLICAWSIC